MSEMLDIPQRLQWLLTHRGISQNALARMSKVSPQTVSNTINNGRIPQSKTINSFAKSLAVSKSVFDPKRALTVSDLTAAVAAGGTFVAPASKPSKSARPSTARTSSSKRTASKPAVAKAAGKPAVSRSVKAVAKPAAKRPVKAAAKPVAAKRAKSISAAASKPVAKRATAPKGGARPAARRTTTAAGKTASTSSVRRSASTTSRSAAVKSTSSSRGGASSARRPAVRGGAAAGWDIDYGVVVSKLQKLANSRKEEVALDACKALLALR